jgi:3-carboxy-cis,cis-muconate cycloisomerase
MPQKRNPLACNYILVCASMTRQHVAAMLEAMVEDHERATGTWEIERIALLESSLLTVGAVAQTREMVAGLQVDAGRMCANLSLTNVNPVVNQRALSCD